jgi:hypothetical protein
MLFVCQDVLNVLILDNVLVELLTCLQDDRVEEIALVL